MRVVRRQAPQAISQICGVQVEQFIQHWLAFGHGHEISPFLQVSAINLASRKGGGRNLPACQGISPALRM
jgi:GTP-dependent phosphoenolpyruvate carboxykinase